MRKVRIGSGAGYGGDRIEPAIDLIKEGNLDYIIFECLAERTIAQAHLQKLRDPNKGYNEWLEYRITKILQHCTKNNVKIITNMGAANPLAAVKKIKEIACELKIPSLNIAVVVGDDVYHILDKYGDQPLIETGEKLRNLKSSIVSANAYIGAEGIVKALENGADVVVTGRAADPALVLGPLIYEFGWDIQDYSLLGKGIMVGHLLECGCQITGGYFADPGYKDVTDIWNLGYPIAEVEENGSLKITKLENTGGIVSPATVKEQILYEIHDPASYLTPDVIADFSNAKVQEISPNIVEVSGVGGKQKSGFYKTSIGYRDGYITECEISYGGSGSYERAKLASDIIKKRLEIINITVEDLRIDFIGYDSLYRESLSNKILGETENLKEVRLRIAGKTLLEEDAERIGQEFDSLMTNGPAGGGGVRINIRQIIAIGSILIPSNDVVIEVFHEEVRKDEIETSSTL
ncbi:acyclic terpene utilization AtuA family protein [Metabacillus bambusae]|uniref:DUF1446 domain-containing protein n=1 Tax=Metabacillus bambusae TaxID=2795218 RepID=A0ABS3N6Y7_9BACI|nr:acyclic terpene utilization AtuA family protein [Metabacillus bambusae]MBO1514051.1 DUF1446 domain-containing protein [Metabacillus bambusae]